MSLVGVLGQLVQSTEALCQFWSCIKDVPAQLQWLIEDTRLLHTTLAGIAQQQKRHGSSIDGATKVPQALQRCVLHLNNLVELIAPLRSQNREARCVRYWKSIRTVLNAQKIELYRTNLETAKSTLLLAQVSLNRSATIPPKYSISWLM